MWVWCEAARKKIWKIVLADADCAAQRRAAVNEDISGVKGLYAGLFIVAHQRRSFSAFFRVRILALSYQFSSLFYDCLAVCSYLP
jgi:hypothetical protein